MPPVVDVSTDGVRVPVSRVRVKATVVAVLRAEKVKDALISVAFVSTRRIAAMNRTHLAHEGPTDVLSFGFAGHGPSARVIGDIYIAPDVARGNALEHGRGVREEIIRLVIHGTLHVLGHRHPEGAGRTASAMWMLQERLVRRLAGHAP